MWQSILKFEKKRVNNVYNELYHHGVLGMKWGVRKDRSHSSGSRRKKSTRHMSQDAREASVIKKKSVSQMSNAELKKINERSRLEQEYSRLNPSTVQKGLKFAGVVAAGMGTVVALYSNGGKIIEIGKEFLKK